jgi:hypothetical protein
MPGADIDALHPGTLLNISFIESKGWRIERTFIAEVNGLEGVSIRVDYSQREIYVI